MRLICCLKQGGLGFALCAWLMLWNGQVSAQLFSDPVPDYEAEPWVEQEAQLPPFPKDQDLYSFYVSPTARSQFFVDRQTLSLGADGVVRYVMVVVSESGVRNISFEGMRCDKRERRIYASGRPDGTWSPARNSTWVRIKEAVTYRQHAALFTDYFCPDGVLLSDFEYNIRRLLERHGKPLQSQD